MLLQCVVLLAISTSFFDFSIYNQPVLTPLIPYVAELEGSCEAATHIYSVLFMPNW